MKALLLDLGEVVIRLNFRSLFEKLGFPMRSVGESMGQLSRWDLYDSFERGHLSSDQFFSALCQKYPVGTDSKRFFEIWNSVMVSQIPGVDLWIETIKATRPVYALSNISPPHLDYFHSAFPVSQRFSRVFASCEMGLRKPQTEIYTQVASQVGIAPGDILFVDDRPENVQGARKAGMVAEHCADSPIGLQAILVKHGFLEKTESAHEAV